MKITCLFSGQGSQYEGMGKKYYEYSQWTREIFHKANTYVNIDLIDICCNMNMNILMNPEFNQPAIVLLSYIQYQIFIRKYQVTPEYFAGHSLGELSALVCSGCIELQEGLILAEKRGKILKKALSDNGRMLAIIGQGEEKLKNICSKFSKYGLCEISNINSNSQYTVSGSETVIENLKNYLDANEIMYMDVNIKIAAHSSEMIKYSKMLRLELENVDTFYPRGKVLSNYDLELYSNHENFIEKFSQQLHSPINWPKIMKKTQEFGTNIYVEFGPQTLIRNMNLDIDNINRTYSMDSYSDRNDLCLILDEELFGVYVVDSTERYNVLKLCIRAIVMTCNYRQANIERKYRELKELSNCLIQSEDLPSFVEVNRAIMLTKEILEQKGLGNKEIEKIITDIILSTGTFDVLDFEVSL